MSEKILFTRRDIAGSNVAGFLREEYNRSPVGCEEILYMDSMVVGEAGLYVVASRHKSVSGRSCLTAHSPGNYGKAEAGGKPGELGVAPALYLREAVTSLQRHRIEGYDVCLEATHHGPTCLKSPMIFVEVGSTIKEWNDPKACRVVAGVINNLIEEKPERFPVAIGFGGGHYCRKFSQVRDYAVGHICPKYNLHNLNRELIKEMMYLFS